MLLLLLLLLLRFIHSYSRAGPLWQLLWRVCAGGFIKAIIKAQLQAAGARCSRA